jgi:ADP-ribosylglycohydrolase
MSHPVSPDAAVGAFVGMAVGDSLGFLVSGESPRHCHEFATHALADDDPPWLERDGFGFGQYAIDTQLARELAASMVEARGFDPARFAARIGQLFGAELAVGPGETTRAAGRRLARGMVWAQSGAPSPASGNGAAIRAVPIGLSFKTAQMRAGAADMQAMITHHDARARAAAQVVAEAVHLAATTAPDPETWLPYLGDLVDQTDPRLASSLRTLGRTLALPPERAVESLAAAGFAADDGYSQPQRISGFSTPTVLFALQAFLRTPDAPLTTLAAALSGGGDTASVCALSGALSGARVGFGNLPIRLQGWARHLNDRGALGIRDLAQLAQRIVAR